VLALAGVGVAAAGAYLLFGGGSDQAAATGFAGGSGTKKELAVQEAPVGDVGPIFNINLPDAPGIPEQIFYDYNVPATFWDPLGTMTETKKQQSTSSVRSHVDAQFPGLTAMEKIKKVQQAPYSPEFQSAVVQEYHPAMKKKESPQQVFEALQAGYFVPNGG